MKNKRRASSSFSLSVLLLLVFFSLVGLASYSYWTLSKELTQDVLARKEAVAHLTAMFLKERFDRLRDLSVSISSRQILIQLAKEKKWGETEQIFQELLKEVPVIDRFVLTDPEGTSTMDVPTIPLIRGKNFAFRDWYKGVRRRWEPYVSEIFSRVQERHEYVVGVASPLKSDTGEVVGVLQLQELLEPFFDWSRSIDQGRSGFIYFVDQNGHVALHPRFPSQGEIEEVPKVLLAGKLLEGKHGVEILFDPLEKEEMLIAYETVSPYGWGVMVEQPARIAFAARDRSLRITLLIYSGILVLACFFAVLILRAERKRRQAEAVAALAKDYTDNLVRSMSDMLVSVDPDAKIQTVNQSTCRSLGYREEELIAKYVTLLFSEEEEEIISTFKGSGLRRLIQAGSIRDKRASWKTKAGERIPVSLSGSVLRDKTWKLLGAVIIARDITERERVEMRLNELMRQLEGQKKALDQFAIVTETDAKGRITYVNDQFCEVAKYKREELIGKDHRDVINSGYHTKEFWKEMWATIGSGQVWRGDIRNRAKDGTIYWVDTTIVSLIGADGKPEKYLAIRAVITERKHAEEAMQKALAETTKRQKIAMSLLEDLEVARKELQERSKSLEAANKRLEELNRLKDEFVAAVSHEFRTPLTAIKEGASLIRDEVLGKVNSEQKDFLTTIDESVDRLAELINNMLDLAKIEAGRMEFKRRKVAIKDLVKTTLKNYQTVVGDRKLKVENLEVSEVFVDPNKVLQIFGNLLSNAIKFTKDDGTITFQATEEKGEVAISVEDDGVGISKEDLPKLFQKFSQVGTAKNQFKGTGLGLALCKEIVEVHKGRIGVTSEPGKGSRFNFTLPVYTSKLALQESFQEQLEIAKGLHKETVGLIAIESDSLKEHLNDTVEFLHKNLHSTDTIVTVEPSWIVVLAATDAKGVSAIIERLPNILKEQTPHSLDLGAALYPEDGADVHHLFNKATTTLNHISIGGR